MLWVRTKTRRGSLQARPRSPAFLFFWFSFSRAAYSPPSEVGEVVYSSARRIRRVSPHNPSVTSRKNTKKHLLFKKICLIVRKNITVLLILAFLWPFGLNVKKCVKKGFQSALVSKDDSSPPLKGLVRPSFLPVSRLLYNEFPSIPPLPPQPPLKGLMWPSFLPVSRLLYNELPSISHMVEHNLTRCVRSVTAGLFPHPI